jgi:hypothetical protein
VIAHINTVYPPGHYRRNRMEGTLQQVFGLIVMVYTNSALVIFISFRDRGLRVVISLGLRQLAKQWL